MNSKLKSAALAGGMLALMAGSASAITAIVETDSNFRSGPGTNYASQFVIPAGSTIDVMDCSGGWCAAVAGNSQGYIAQSLVSIAGGGGPAVAVSPGYGGGYYDPYYYDDYAYGYGPGYWGPSVGFGVWVDRDRRHHWRGRDRDRRGNWSHRGNNRDGQWSRQSGARNDNQYRGRMGNQPRAQYSGQRNQAPRANFSGGQRDGGPAARGGSRGDGGRGGDGGRRGDRS